MIGIRFVLAMTFGAVWAYGFLRWKGAWKSHRLDGRSRLVMYVVGAAVPTLVSLLALVVAR